MEVRSNDNELIKQWFDHLSIKVTNLKQLGNTK